MAPLIGIGRLLVAAPDASTFWSWAFIVLGLAVVPLWWHDAFVIEKLGVERVLDREAEPAEDKKHPG